MNVQKNKFALLLAASAVSIALSGCGGDDGKDGEPGNSGGTAAQEINTLNLDITQVTYNDGVPTVTVFATNEKDLPVVGLKDIEIENAAQLIPQGAAHPGDSANWQKLGSTDQFVDNKDGSYQFTFDSFSTDVFDPQLTQRFNVVAPASTLLDGVTPVPVREIVEDFDGEGNEALYTKNVVSHEVCASCHVEGEKIYHRATSVETCITCHTQEWAESRGKPEVAFSHLIHNVHNDAKVFGRNDKLPETAHKIVQDNCQACHVQSDELTEWGNWSRVPTMEVCSSCHVDIDFKAGQGHSQQNDNSNCIACHNASWTETIHTEASTQKKALIDQYGINVESTIDATTQAATISIAVVDAAGNAVDINTVLPMVQRFEVVTNVGPNNVTLGYGGKDSINAVTNGVLAAGVTIDAGKLVYTTSKDLKLGVAGADDETAFTFVGWAMCSTDGAFVDCDPALDADNVSLYTGMKAGLAYATLSGQEPSKRHVDSVAFSACANCHTPEFEVHKGGHHAGFVMSEQLSHTTDANGNAIIGVDACVACHTPDGTYAGGTNKGALEMKLHVVHGQEGIIKDCAQCHNDFNLDSFQVKGALATAAGTYTTPITATCTSCHTSDSVKTHATSQGAVIDGAKDVANDAAQLESCFFCHAPVIEDHTKMKM
ncbi:OmcA/MtrC family decaheme c-type cytochrome [Shewanella sp. Isolate11]|uniref:OmcA/MtrC family decaheme c-type cytochrome n=1 Tax=Shewanella sp. Isolate11 TaxID=2908530 RepID=UPI0031F2DF2D